MRIIQEFSSSSSRIGDFYIEEEAAMEALIEFLKESEILWRIVRIVIILLSTRGAVAILKRMWRRNPKNSQFLFRKFVYKIAIIVIYILGILFAIGQIPGLTSIVETLLAGSGIVALGLSLSAQESLENVIAGIFITSMKPFEVGDRVTIVSKGITGNVEDITLRHTIIKTFTNTRIVVPNSTMNSEIIENSNIVDSRASAYVDVTVAFESDLDKAIEILADVVGNHPKYLDVRTEEDIANGVPKVKVYARAFEGSGIALRASMWTKTINENFEACSDARIAVKKAFDAAGIEIPYTKYTILYQHPHDGFEPTLHVTTTEEAQETDEAILEKDSGAHETA